MRSNTKFSDVGGTFDAVLAPEAGPSGPAVDVWPTPETCLKFTHFTARKQGETAQTVYVEPVTVTRYFSHLDLYADFEAMLAFFYPNAATRPATGAFDGDGWAPGGILTPNGIPDAAEFAHLSAILCDVDDPRHAETLEIFQGNLDLVYELYTAGVVADARFALPDTAMRVDVARSFSM